MHPELLDHSPVRFDYSAAPDREPLRWPGNARVAVWVAPNIEHYEYQPELIRIRDPWPRVPHPDILGYAQRDYGNRAGLWRMIEVFDRFAIPCTVSLSASVLERYPAVTEAMLSRRWELMSHGLYNTRYHWGLSEADERAAIQACQDIHVRVTGERFRGWFSPAASNTLNTPDLIAEAGIDYLCDLYHDDEPTPLRVRRGRLVSLPYSMEINDSIAWRRGQEGEAFGQHIRDAFDTLWQEGARTPRVMNIAVHPFIMGQPHRAQHLANALEYIASHAGVWFARGSEIVDAYLAQRPIASV